MLPILATDALQFFRPMKQTSGAIRINCHMGKDISRLSVKLKLLTGSYILQSKRIRMYKTETEATCLLCKEKEETMEHFCRSCVKLSSTEYKLLTKRSDLHWYCPPCEEKAMKNLKIEKEVEKRCNKYFSKYEKRLDEMENKLDKKVELDEVKALIQENKESAATGGNDQDGTLTSQLEEFKESMARKSNIIIFRAEESKKTEPKERKVEDIAIVNELCKITGTNKQTVKNVTRLGKKDVDSDNPRPMIEMPVKNQLQGMLAVFEPLDRAQSKKNFEPSFVKIG